MSKLEASLIITIVMSGMVGWYFYWVKPQDDLRRQVVSCMSESAKGLQHYDRRSLYEYCHSKVVQ